jgi:transcriptional regulator with XRE-family HTH domain
LDDRPINIDEPRTIENRTSNRYNHVVVSCTANLKGVDFMEYRNLTFGEFIIQKRKEKKLSARQLAITVDITPEYLCEIEKGRKTAVSEEILSKIIRILNLSEQETELFYDLAAISRNAVSADLPEYIMAHELVRAAIRTAKKHNIPDEKWERFIKEIIREE